MSAPRVGITSLETRDWPEEWYPSGPRAFAKRARGAGWDARMAFSRGRVPAAKTDEWDVRDMIGVWLDGYGQRLAAFWERNPEAQFSAKKLDAGVKAGEIPSGMVWAVSWTAVFLGPGIAFPYPNLTELDEMVAAKGDVGPEWWAYVEHRVRAARARAKSAPASAAKERDHA